MSVRYPRGAPSAMRPDALGRRASGVAVFLSLWMVIIVVRLVQLQVSQHEWLTARARIQQQDAVETSPLRGLIFDRAGRELARSLDTESFFAVPGEIEDIDAAAARLGLVLNTDAAGLAARLRRAKEAKRKFVWLARKVDAERGAALRALQLKGVHVTKEPKRRYPNGSLAAHILGFVGMDEAGLAGVEQFQNAALVGEAGKVFVEGDARGKTYASLEVTPRPGQSIVLTIDQIVQYRTEQALGAAVARARARSGTAIVLDPRTGQILALANAPTFDPNDATRVTAEMRANQALQYIYEPGSTFKVVAFSAAIEEGLAQPDDRIDCQMGAINVAGRRVRDHAPFGTLTMTEALAKSSNVAAIKLGLRVGNATMYDYITRFGFGARTGIELAGETAGLLRPVTRWHPSSMGSIAIGQEIGVTPLQMVVAFGALANDGIRFTPHLVREVRAADNTVVRRAKPEARRVIEAETARTVRQMLETVTLKGTARAAQLDGYTAAGKTGTAQKIDPQTKSYSKTKHVASFVGFAPVENPSVAIIVVIDEPIGAYHGGDVAAPVFREIAESVLPYLNVVTDAELKSEQIEGLIARASSSPLAGNHTAAAAAAAGGDDPEELADHVGLPEFSTRDAGEGVGEVVHAVAAERALLMPDLRGNSVRDVARVCAHLGLDLEARGDGRAFRQSPAAGAEIEVGQVVRVEFARSD